MTRLEACFGFAWPKLVRANLDSSLFLEGSGHRLYFSPKLYVKFGKNSFFLKRDKTVILVENLKKF